MFPSHLVRNRLQLSKINCHTAPHPTTSNRDRYRRALSLFLALVPLPFSISLHPITRAGRCPTTVRDEWMTFNVTQCSLHQASCIINYRWENRGQSSAHHRNHTWLSPCTWELRFLLQFRAKFGTKTWGLESTEIKLEIGIFSIRLRLTATSQSTLLGVKRLSNVCNAAESDNEVRFHLAATLGSSKVCEWNFLIKFFFFWGFQSSSTHDKDRSSDEPSIHFICDKLNVTPKSQNDAKKIVFGMDCAVDEWSSPFRYCYAVL